MKKSKVLLTAINAKYIHSNLAVYSLRANAGKYADRIKLAEYTINHRREEILRGLYREAPEIIGFSCYIWNIEYVLDVAQDLKKILPETTIILGGPEVSYDAPRVMEQYPFVDFVIMGEGEVTFREFLDCYYERGDLEQLDGICLRKDGEILVNPPARPAVMDDLAFPYEDISDMENRIIYYETMRGCPFSCSYCLSSIEKNVRIRSLPLVFRELQFFLDQKVKQVKFVDRTFNCNHEHAYRIWEYISEHDNGITNFHFEIGGDLLREEDFELFRGFRPGLIQFEIGVQSTNPRTIEAIRRKMDLTQLGRHIEKVRENHNIHQHLDLIAGLPFENLESFRRSFDDVYAMKPDQFQLGFLKILKGSYMDEVKEFYGIRFGSKPPYEVLTTRWLSYEDILCLKKVEEMVEVYYNSFQFSATMILLELHFDSAFSMYESLGEYYDQRGLFERKHTRLARYEILWDYVKENFREHLDDFRQTLTYDMYLRDYIKSPPGFVKQRSREYLRFVRAFLDRETESPHVLSGYDGFVTKQLFNMVYVDEFTVDMELLLESRRLVNTAPYSIVFDYKHRNELNHSAAVTIISGDCDEFQKGILRQ